MSRRRSTAASIPANGASRSSTPPTRCSPSAPTTRSRSRTSRAPPASPAGSCTTTSAVARRSTSRCSSGSAPSARNDSRRPWVAALVRAWRIPCRAGLTGPRRTARSGSPRSRAARTSPTPTSGAWSPTSCAAPSRCSRRSTPTSPRTRRGCATRSSAGPGSTAPRRDAGYTGKPPARRHTSCSPRRSSTSCAPSALRPAPSRRPSRA